MQKKNCIYNFRGYCGRTNHRARSSEKIHAHDGYIHKEATKQEMRFARGNCKASDLRM